MARYGVTPLLAERPDSVDTAIENAVHEAKRAGLCADGDLLVVAMSRTSPRSDTDTIYVWRT
jgi:pyruvate kinase